MRLLITALLAFAAGILLMVAWHPHPSGLPNVASNAATVAAPGSSTQADPSDNDDDWPDQGPTPEQVIYAQPSLLQQALSKLGPHVNGKPNLYLVAFAGDGSEDVFRNEAEYAAQLFTTRFGPTTHALVLENNPATLTRQPLASLSNLDLALDQLHSRMSPDDILMLYLTTHGDEDHNLYVDMDPLPLDQIAPEDIADLLQRHPFKWKTLVVSSCYAGGFIPPLRGDNTLILTAARSDRSSFGCGSDSDITYFGHAWLVDALNQTSDLITAFKRAQSEIAQWEKRDGLIPSEPQIDIGNAIAAQLALWRKGFTPGPAVPFKPPTPTSGTSRTQ